MMATSGRMTLADLAPGEVGRVAGIDLEDSVRSRLIEMGMTMGQQVKVHRKAPLGGPMSVELRGYQLALRLTEARCILVETETAEPAMENDA